MSFALTPSKRPYDRTGHHNGRGKRNNPSSQQTRKVSPSSTVFRVLCASQKTGSVIGKSGSIVSSIRKQTGAKIIIEEGVPGCEERVVVIVASDKDKEVEQEQTKDSAEEDNVPDDGMDSKEENEGEDKKEKDSAANDAFDKGCSSAEKALMLVFERLVAGEYENGHEDEATVMSSPFVVRLLVPSIQVGCILGKGGNVIKQLSADSGAQIRVLSTEKAPLCASASEEVVQITGVVDAARKALQAVAQQLVKNPPRERDLFPAGKGFPRQMTGSGPFAEVAPPPNIHFSGQGPRHHNIPFENTDFQSNAPSIPKYPDPLMLNQMNNSFDILTFRLLCNNEHVGGIIGKGGSIIRSIHNETGADIKILDPLPDTEDRVVVISAPAHPGDRIAAAQDAILRIQSRIAKSSGDEKTATSRLLIPSNLVGCLLGKGGSVIAEMRKLSGAYIRISPKDQVSKCAGENEELVFISGDFEAVQEALIQITSRLRHNMFQDKFSPSINNPLRSGFPDHAPPVPPFMGMRPSSPRGMYPNYRPSSHKLDPLEAFPPFDERPGFAHTVHMPGFPPERMPPPGPWPPHQGASGGIGVNLPEFPGSGPRSRPGGFPSRPAVITNTTVEVVVPRAFVPSIYGEDGECLKQIRQISGAKITITEPRPGDTETVIIISGTPEQTHAAQSLLQAFVMSGQGTP